MLRNTYGRYMQSHELMPLLGFGPGGHLPPTGFEPRNVQGTTFRCLPATTGRRKHRIEYHCDRCDRWIPFGRAGQHSRGVYHRYRTAFRELEEMGPPRVSTRDLPDTF